MSSTSESSNAYDGLDPSDMSPDDILNILAKFLGSPDHLIQSPDSSSSDSISDIELARSRHSSTYTAETVYHPSESSYVDYTTMGDATHEEESHASEGSVMPSYRGTVSATHTEDDMVQYLDSTEQTRIKDVQGSELALLYQSPTTPINAGNYSIYDAHFQCQQQQQIDHVLGEHAPVLREDPPVNTAPALPVVAAAEQDVQMGAPGFSYPLVIHIPEYIPGVDGPPPEHLSTRKKRKALNAPESLCSRNAPKKQRSLQYIPAVDAQVMAGEPVMPPASRQLQGRHPSRGMEHVSRVDLQSESYRVAHAAACEEPKQ
ncbi:hypothetical protein CERSUDRAFT_98249 [Gelatoporia subvermispora B]|uniref:Uncharacterized protein n=1 Tax=Ceriporiopsis subvermispora (strain B) TaxID=914234 RepID=M2R698_CERS8|nr:hypothetical protein CERSUDRAFT_98249 [Gelatoporia subvermispora B]